MFHFLAKSPLGRRGRLFTPHGTIETPFFLPVATGGAMRGITNSDLFALGAQVLLCNTYHLHLQPGENVIVRAGGLHKFLSWDKPILTDSGGFQVFSMRHNLKVEHEGVHFRSHLDGSPLFLGPEEAMEIQWKLGSDILMCFDECPPSTAPRKDIVKAVDRTLRWAKKCKEVHEEYSCRGGIFLPYRNILFAIIQGGLERDLREKCAQELIAMNFDGYALGGLAVGESEEEMYGVLDAICPMLPEEKPRYLMGVGRLEQLKTCIAKGIDMFDCVLPMREARHGTLWVSNGSRMHIENKKYITDHSPIDPHSPSPLSRTHLKSFLCHLFRSHERLAETISCMQNLGVTLKIVKQLREGMDTRS